jgi:peptide/nickel transport system substrate-binding protein
MMRHLAVAVFLVLALTCNAWAQKSADTLRITWREAVPDLDPYRNSTRNGLVVAFQAWDGLVARDPETFAIKPLLATSWKYSSDTTIDFELRPGVVFHNGDPFTADDVVYTVNQAISDPTVAVPSNYAWLAGAEKLGPLQVRLRLKRVFPAALEFVALTLPILPQAYREAVGPAGYSRAPVGAGPYRIVRAEPELIEMERFSGYYDGSPKGRPAIGRLLIREGGDGETELGDLQSGRADWIWQFLPERSAEIARNPALVELRAESMRLGYLSMDAAGRSGDTPLVNLKVRQAVAAAIDRATLARTLVQGGARVPEAPCYPTQFGCDAQAAVPAAFDRARARALLAEAGYPDGFHTELVSYVLPEYTQAVAANLASVGIIVDIVQLPLPQALVRAASGQAPLYMGSWGSYSINDVQAFLPYFFTGGDNDYARVPELQALIEQGGATTSVDRRRAFYGRAIRMITEQSLWLPLHSYVTTYGMSRALAFRPTADELPRFYLASWR